VTAVDEHLIQKVIALQPLITFLVNYKLAVVVPEDDEEI